MTRYPLLLLTLTLTAVVPAAADQTLTPADQPARAPAFDAPDTEGRRHRLDDYLGNALVVNFWASWCGPCVKEMPALDRAAEALRADDIAVLGFNMGETVEDIARFTEQVPVDFPLLLDENMQQGPAWGLKGLPTTFVVDPDGTIVYKVVGERAWDDPALLDQIRAVDR